MIYVFKIQSIYDVDSHTVATEMNAKMDNHKSWEVFSGMIYEVTVKRVLHKYLPCGTDLIVFVFIF